MTPVRTLATVRHHGMELADHEFTVPLDHDAPAGETLTIFARAVKHSDLPVDASSGSSRSLHYRWVAAALGQPRRLLPAHVSRSATQGAEVLRALSGRSRALRTDPRYLHRHEVTLPTGGRLTIRRFQQLGFMLGFDDGMENLHYLLESAFCGGAGGDELSLPFPRALSEQTAASIAGMKVWLTNEYEHNGLRASPAVFERLLAMQRERV